MQVRQTVTDIEARLADSDDTAFRPLEVSVIDTLFFETLQTLHIWPSCYLDRHCLAADKT